MVKKPLTLACVLLTAALLAGTSLVSPALAQGKKLKIGVVRVSPRPCSRTGTSSTCSARSRAAVSSA